MPLAVTFTMAFPFYKFGRGTLGQFVHLMKPFKKFFLLITYVSNQLECQEIFLFFIFYFPNIHGNGAFPDIHANGAIGLYVI